MTVIFKDILNKETLLEILSQNKLLSKTISVLSGKKLIMRICSLCIIGMLAVGVSIVSVGITLGFKVNYAGSIIATIKNAAVFDDAKSIAVKSIESSNAAGAIKQPNFKMTLTVSNRLCSALKLADAIIENTNDIVEASALVVNGETLLCGETEELAECLEKSRTRFETKGAENTSEFTDEVKTEKGYYLKSEIASADELTAAAEKLNVKTVLVITTDTEIPFTTKTVKTSNELIGYSSVKTAGQNGINRKTENVEKLNGEEVAREELKTEVVKEPVEQVTLVGTAKSTATAAQRIAARSEGLICPLSKGSFVVSSYYGDGRGHKGMDLAADRGTGIYASAAGTVVSAGFDGAYGYSVVVDHGNGLKTRYAHASALKVAKGARVEQGDLLALVGNTGNSTGNHLHYEVLVNDTRVNPAPYIGLD